MSSEGDSNVTEVNKDETEQTKETQAPVPDPVKKVDVEKEQEAKLRSKYPSMALKGPGSSAFLQKRLSKGKQYFDSGDYNMAKAKKGGANKAPITQKQKLLIPASTGDTIPTPESVTHRKASLMQSKLIS